jgi:transcriptional regulator with XRE-family HTH domain
MIAFMTKTAHTTGHSRHLREVLRARRESMKLRQQDVADRITEELELDDRLTGGAVSEWERFTRHPELPKMQAWARVLGLRLLVDLDDEKSTRIPVLVRPENADLVREIDLLEEDDLRYLRDTVSRIAPPRRR